MLSGGGLTEASVSSGIMVNGQVIGDKQIPPNGVINTYFSRFGILHQALGVRMEVSTHDISVFQNGKWIKILWSEAASLKGTKWEAQLSCPLLLSLMQLWRLLTGDALLPFFLAQFQKCIPYRAVHTLVRVDMTRWTWGCNMQNALFTKTKQKCFLSISVFIHSDTEY